MAEQEWKDIAPTNERLAEIAREYAATAGEVGPELDGPGAASAFYMSCSLSEIAAMATELLSLRAPAPNGE